MFEVSWVVERRRAGLAMSYKCDGSFVCLCIPGAARADGCCIQLWNRHGAGEWNAVACLWWDILRAWSVTDTMLTNSTVLLGLILFCS